MGKARDVRTEVNLLSHSHLESQDLELLSNQFGSDDQSVIGKHFVKEKPTNKNLLCSLLFYFL